VTRSKILSQVPGAFWVVGPALAAVPALFLEPAWRILYLGVVFVGLPVAFLVQDARPWLFVLCALPSFNYSKVILGDPRLAVADPAVLELRVMELPILVLLGIMLFRAASPGRDPVRPPRELRPVLVVGALLVGWILLSSLAALRTDVVLVSSIHYVRMLLALGVVAACARRPDRIAWALAGLFTGLAAQSALAIAQSVAGSSFGLYGHFEEEGVRGFVTRSGGTLNPTVLAEFIGLVAPLVLASAFAVRRRALSLALLALFGVATAAVFLTLSRQGVLSLALSTLVVVGTVLLRPGLPRVQKLAIIAATLLLVAGVGAYASGALMTRAASLAAELESNDTGRLSQMLQALGMIRDNPVTGVGLGGYVANMGRYGSQLPYPVHNKLLGVTAETGIPGGLMYLGLWSFVLVVFLRRTRRRTGPSAVLSAGFAGAVLGTLVTMNLDVYATGGAAEMTLFVITGIGLALPERLERERGDAR
jgi:O-antigen ligase